MASRLVTPATASRPRPTWALTSRSGLACASRALDRHAARAPASAATLALAYAIHMNFNAQDLPAALFPSTPLLHHAEESNHDTIA